MLAAAFLTAVLALTGCSASDSAGSSADGAAGGANEKAVGDSGAGAGAGAADRANASQVTKAPDLTKSHIIRTAKLTVRVKDVPKALDAARTAAESAGGFVGDESTSRDEEGRERTRVVLRVPTDAYEEVLAELEGTGRLVEREAKAKDVTEQVVDVESRITTQRASVARIRELMDRATKLSDVVTLEGELSSRQADLEALLAQQASLKDRTSLATITLHLSEAPVQRSGGEDDDPGIVDALAGGWNAFVTMLRWIVLVLGAILPFALALALVVFLWLRLVRPRLPHRPARAQVQAQAPATTDPERESDRT